MPKPRRRRRFFALEGRFEVDDTGELSGIVDPAAADLSSSVAPPADGEFVPPGSDVGSRDLAGHAGSSELLADETLPPAFRLNRAPGVRPAPLTRSSRASIPLALLCLIAGGLAGYFWPRGARESVVADSSNGRQKEVATLTPADRNDLDLAYAARHSHDFAEADRLFTALGHRHPGWGPIEVEAGRTLFYENKPSDASNVLKKAVEKGWKPAEAEFLLGVVYKGGRSYPEAEASFAEATAADPTQPEYYFFWGECLREEGKLLEATAKFRSALLRNQYETATGLYRSKLWLCSIEAGQAPGDGVNAEVDASLAQAHPPMEAFIAGAARDLKAGDLRAAAAHLTAAGQRSEPSVFRYLLGDPTFAEVRSKPEFANIFQVPSPAAGPETGPPVGSPPPSGSH